MKLEEHKNENLYFERDKDVLDILDFENDIL